MGGGLHPIMDHSETPFRLEARPRRGDAETGGVPLPPGWTCLRDCNIGGRLSQPAQVAYVLLHPEAGVALLDIGRAAADDVEAVLRARLRAACFEGIFPGYLPVVHLVAAPGDLPAIEGALEEAFAALPPLSLPGGDAWTSVVRRALSPQDPARGAAPLSMSGERQGAADRSRDRPAARPMPSRIIPARVTDPSLTDETDSGEETSPLAFPLPTPEPRRPWAWAAALGGFVLLSGLAALLVGGLRPASGPAAANPPVAAAAPVATQGPQPAVPLPPAPPGRNDSIAAGAPTPTPPAEGAATDAPAPTAVVRVRANLRAGPSLSATVLRTLPPGREFEIHDRTPDGWLQVGDAEPLGWMHSSVLTESQP